MKSFNSTMIFYLYPYFNKYRIESPKKLIKISQNNLREQGTIACIQLSGNNERVFFFSQAKLIFCYNLENMQLVSKISNIGGLYLTSCFVVSFDAQFCIGMDKDKEFVSKVNANNQRRIYFLKKSGQQSNTIHMLEDVKRLILSSGSKQCNLYNLSSNKRIDKDSLSNDNITAVCNTPLKHVIGVGGWSSKFKFFSVLNSFSLLFTIDVNHTIYTTNGSIDNSVWALGGANSSLTIIKFNIEAE